VILFRHETPAAAILNLQEALVAVRHAVRAANGVVIGRADLLAAAEQETLDAPLHGHHVHVFPVMERRDRSVFSRCLVDSTFKRGSSLSRRSRYRIARRSRGRVGKRVGRRK